MQAERLKILHHLLKTEPEEPFNRYALAMEYIGQDPDEALRHLNILLDQHPEYLATYYQAATLYAEQDNIEQATLVFEKGIALAEERQNHKTLQELKGAFQMYKDEWEAI